MIKLIKINDDKYTINPEFIKTFATREGIKTEIIITYNIVPFLFNTNRKSSLQFHLCNRFSLPLR